MEVISLQSGSNGNCIFVDTGRVQLLFDAGISLKKAEERLAKFGRKISDVDAMVVSHEHRDHVGSLGVFSRRLKIPIYITSKTLRATCDRIELGKSPDTRCFCSGDAFAIDDVRIETIPTPHDGVDGSAFTIDNGECRFGLWTDLGHVTDDFVAGVDSLDALLIESNYDPGMLRDSPYPDSLKRRIRGGGGHLSNDEAAELVSLASDQLQWICLAHLSNESNRPDVAERSHRDLLGAAVRIVCASRTKATGPLRIDASRRTRPSRSAVDQQPLLFP